MTPFVEEILLDCLHDALSWEQLHDPQIGGVLNAEQLHDLCLAAGYSKEAAEKAASKRALDRLRQDLPP